MVLGALGSLMMFLIPFIIIIGVIVAIASYFGNVQETQRDFLRALFDRTVSISDFLDGTEEGQRIHDFIVFARYDLAQVEREALIFFQANDIENLETRTDLSRTEIRESPKITPEVAILRMKVVYYSVFLHEFSPLPIHANEEEIWAHLVEYDEPPTIDHNPWGGYFLTNHADFVRSFFEMEYAWAYPDDLISSNRGRFLWARVDNESDISPFFNSIIYRQIHENVGRTVTAHDEVTIETIWDALTNRIFVHFTGRFATPIEPQYMNNITSPFGYRSDPFTGTRSFHSGVDFAWAGCLGAPIFTVDDGIVRQAHDTGNGFGIMVIVEHPNGWQTWYAHASEVFVSVGEQVDAGQRIAAIGSTGRSTAPHLHFELRIAGRPVDPLQLFR